MPEPTCYFCHATIDRSQPYVLTYEQDTAHLDCALDQVRTLTVLLSLIIPRAK